ncbi:MAG: prepilin peptidase [Fimbriimonadaceae bacterium]|nr:prepilin peptidase [Fimbriimonadaceae bacterium]
MFPEWTWLVGLWLGATVGSFLNVVVYRTPRNLSLSDPPRSFCPKCRHPLGLPDLVPLFSWLALRGRCRHCGAKVASRYFFVELINGAIWAGLWYRFFVDGHDPARFVAFAAAASTLVAVVFIDWELYIIPDQVNAFLWLVGILYNVALLATGAPEAWTWGMPSALAGWLAGVGALWGVAVFGRVLFRKDAMGHGDIKLARGIGAVLFPLSAFVSFALAIVLGAVLGVVQVLLLKGQGDAEGGPAEDAGDEGAWEPESIGSLFKSGLGYFLCIDIVGLFVPRLYESWFGEPAFAAAEEIEEFEVERTMIPFGPYLALGAVATMLFEGPLRGLWDRYFDWAFGGPAFVEHFHVLLGHIHS